MGGIDNPSPIVNNFAATTDPTSTSDSTLGYSIGSSWFNSSTGMFWRCALATASAAIWVPSTPNVGGYPASKDVPVVDCVFAATAVATLDTVIYMVPFTVPQKLVSTKLKVRVSTGGTAGSAVKMGIWAHDYVTSKRAMGLPLASSNTGQATTSNNSSPEIACVLTFWPNVTYWFGAEFTTAAPTMIAIGNSHTAIAKLAGRTIASSMLTGFSVTNAYADDITALNMTGKTFDEVTGAAGIPIPHLTN